MAFLDRSTASFHKESGSDFHLMSRDLTNAAVLFFLDKRLPPHRRPQNAARKNEEINPVTKLTTMDCLI